ncbi:uroporphyrinogen-III synthase [Stakelama sp. CBK3Z-3]|uniref:Uroporphyrinogen-III synthase n=1 Tax=Stakelama flava TaxID=2860338 RepID=A0ABS6XKF8_9SPHN|nr:uroporphyrinogen-III synthase [Stakelama flava]MBW4330695.1 uroporphyrinogen-III synthase [Stakelama flava]
MSRSLVVLRPEPGNSQTARRIEEAGFTAIRLPLFVVRPLPWPAPERAHDALILTSANAMRHGGAQLAALTGLPVYAVGPATAMSAQAMGFKVVRTGSEGVDALLDQARADGVRRALHLTGRDHRLSRIPPIAEIREVYASEACAIDTAATRSLEQQVALVHSPRAGEAFAALADREALNRGKIAIAAISPAAAQAVGGGWRNIAVADAISDAAVIAAATSLAD